MDIATRNYIDNLSNWIISTYDISIPIRNIENIVKKIGGTVEEKFYFDDLSDGTIKKTGDNNFIIQISPFQSSQRRSFTIAHELGHLFLHMGYRTSEDVWHNQSETIYRRFGTSEQEHQANEFAAAFLMPKNEYRRILDANTDTKTNKIDIEKVADYFDVSVLVATNRGKLLGNIEW